MNKHQLRKLGKMWTLEAYLLLYTELVKQFGPYSEWKTSTCPFSDIIDAEKYEKWVIAFATAVGANSGEAVKNQIAWAITKQDDINALAFATLFLKNKTVAYECGFIGTGNMPSKISVGYQFAEDDGVTTQETL